MAEKTVTGDVLQQNYELQKKFNEFQRQINQKGGYPYDFAQLIRHLQNGVDGTFELIVMDQADKYKGNLRKFFTEVFGIACTASSFTKKKLTQINGMQHFMYVPAELSVQAIREAEKTIFPNSVCYFDGNIDERIGIQQDRPVSDYWISHVGGIESDATHRNKSYNQFSVDGSTYMIIKEYMLCRLFAYWLRKEVWDKKGFTITSTLGAGGGVVGGYWRVGRFGLYWDDRDSRRSDGGPRSAVLF